MDSGIVTAVVTQVGAILIASGGWYFGAKKDREKTREAVNASIQGVKDDLADMGANLQQKVALVELEVGHTRQDINTLSNRVDKHNNIIERTYKCEQAICDIKEDIKELKDV